MFNKQFRYKTLSLLWWQWSRDAVERREFAGKKAKLAAAELAKLSRRFSGELSLKIKSQSYFALIACMCCTKLTSIIIAHYILISTMWPLHMQTVNFIASNMRMFNAWYST